jgi:hypothetical protein
MHESSVSEMVPIGMWDCKLILALHLLQAASQPLEQQEYQFPTKIRPRLLIGSPPRQKESSKHHKRIFKTLQQHPYAWGLYKVRPNILDDHLPGM